MRKKYNTSDAVICLEIRVFKGGDQHVGPPRDKLVTEDDAAEAAGRQHRASG
jgi:hypothetical protein